jgi:hypothetical protein
MKPRCAHTLSGTTSGTESSLGKTGVTATSRFDEYALRHWFIVTFYFKDREASATRCRVALDAGKTIAGTDAYICLHFARGNCSNGSK